MTWFAQHWDKVLGFFISVILGGVVGFFSAMLVVQEKMGDLEERLVIIENAEVPYIGENKRAIGSISGRVQKLESEISALRVRSVMLTSRTEIMLQQRIQD